MPEPTMPAIEKNLPIPDLKRKGPRYGLNRLQPGDSIWVSKAQSLREAASHYRRRHPRWKYTTRREKEGCRLWRVG